MMSEWQPIETAPKDETVLLFWPASYVGAYVTGRRYRDGGPWKTNIDGLIETAGGRGPTHWMPLPTPPTTQTTKPAASG